MNIQLPDNMTHIGIEYSHQYTGTDQYHIVKDNG